MTEMARDGAMAEANQTRVNGAVEMLTSHRVAGWAIDRSDAAAAVKVEILREGRPYQTVIADRPRPDLEKGGIGTGRYGFAVDIDPPVEQGFEFTISVLACTSDGHSTPLKAVGRAEYSVSPELRLLLRLMTSVDALAANMNQSEAKKDALVEISQRLEIAQARLEAAITAIEARPEPDRAKWIPWITYGAGLTGLISLGIGFASLWYL